MRTRQQHARLEACGKEIELTKYPSLSIIQMPSQTTIGAFCLFPLHAQIVPFCEQIAPLVALKCPAV